MPIVREKKDGYFTVMNNYHLRDQNLSLKAKGLLSMVLSLPDDWEFSLAGLTAICKEGKDSISNTLFELERRGYLVRERARNEHGWIRGVVYTFYERSRPRRSLPVSD